MQTINIVPTSSYIMNQHGPVMVGNIGLQYWHGNGTLHITDLSNAHQRGKTCDRFSINTDFGAPDCALLNWGHVSNRTPEQLLEYLRRQIPEANNTYKETRIGEHFGAWRSVFKGVNCWNPDNHHHIKPLKSRPKKWTIPNVIRALVNKQGHLHRDEKLTDDYAFDAATNFGRGDYDPLELAKDLVTDPSGYRAWLKGDNQVIIACHHFLYYSLYLKGI